jgi:hypothetical protein
MSYRDLGPKKLIFIVFSFIIGLVIADIFASTLLIYYYRWKNVEGIAHEASAFSLVNLAIEAASRAGVYEPDNNIEEKIETLPHNFFVPDPQLGYALRPGQYELVFSRSSKDKDKRESLKTKVTITNAGRRWTGECGNAVSKRSIYIFGGSTSFGYGLNDEQTYAFLLQNSSPRIKIELLAAAGYSFTQAFLNFENIKDKISERDIIILDYSETYNIRNVVAPSHLREVEEWNARRHHQQTQSWLWPKFTLDQDGSLTLSYIQQNCALNRSYCNQPDPPKEYMTKLSAALINRIARDTQARIYVLHYEGNPKDHLFGLLDKRVTLISALNGDFDYFVRDSIVGFDSHPGPYWHYAIFKKLKAVLGNNLD